MGPTVRRKGALDAVRAQAGVATWYSRAGSSGGSVGPAAAPCGCPLRPCTSSVRRSCHPPRPPWDGAGCRSGAWRGRQNDRGTVRNSGISRDHDRAGHHCRPQHPAGHGAIGLVRISGPDAVLLLRSVAAKRWTATPPPAGHPGGIPRQRRRHRRSWLATVFRAPASYTGEDVVESRAYTAPYVQQRLIEALLQAGEGWPCPASSPSGVFLNRKLDLSQAEAVADPIASQSAAQHRWPAATARGLRPPHRGAAPAAHRPVRWWNWSRLQRGRGVRRPRTAAHP